MSHVTCQVPHFIRHKLSVAFHVFFIYLFIYIYFNKVVELAGGGSVIN